MLISPICAGSVDQAAYVRPSSRILTIKQVQALNSLSRASIYRAMSAGTFPRPIRLSPGGRRVGWRETDVRDWLADPVGWRQSEL